MEAIKLSLKHATKDLRHAQEDLVEVWFKTYQALGPHYIKAPDLINGPTDVGSSTRSELGGFTGAPLILIQAISRYWGLKHRCKFYWIRENMKYPDNSDYVSVICDIVKQLQQPI